MCSKNVEDRVLSSVTYAGVPVFGATIPGSCGVTSQNRGGLPVTCEASAAIEALTARLSHLGSAQPGILLRWLKLSHC